ncbi:MAG: hypothetical protein JNM36_14505 [Chitinophagales bacterium]|nr:hypothetical protein [Chitinophagales bacterium]
MTETRLSLLQNRFDNVTKHSLKRMHLLSRDFMDKLTARKVNEPDLLPIYTEILPVSNTFFETYNFFQNQSSFYRGSTNSFQNAIKELSSSLIRRWAVAIENEYPVDSSTYLVCFPDGRDPFHRGNYELRLSAVRSLVDKLERINNPNLADLTVKIATWYNETLALRTQQQGDEGEESRLRQQLEDSRLAMANAMHLAFFKLCVHYFPNLPMVETFYEMRYLRVSNTKPKAAPVTNRSLNIKAKSRQTVLSSLFTENDGFFVENAGNTDLLVWLSSDEHSPIPADVVTIAPKESNSYFADELADGSATWNFLVVYNPSENEAGKLKVVKIDDNGEV